MNKEIRETLLRQFARELKTPALLREHASLARRAAKESWGFEDYLCELLTVEVNSRRDKAVARRIRDAKFPDLKTLDQIDWEELNGIGRPQVQELAAGDFIDRRHDVVIAGPIGTGKTHVAIALGVAAARHRRRVLFTRAADLVQELIEARDARCLGRLKARCQRADLLILDELGFVPFDKTGGELLFNLLADRYERRSTLITTNLDFSEWVNVFGSEKLTTALLDRICHHAAILSTEGPSYRSGKRKNKS